MINFYKYHNNSSELILATKYYIPLMKLSNKKYSKHLLPIVHIIKKSPMHAYYYVQDVMKTRWPEAEPYILMDVLYARWYAEYTIKGRWPELEPLIITDAGHAYCYASWVIKGRWLEAEQYIKKDEYWWYRYRTDFDVFVNSISRSVMNLFTWVSNVV